ncbi:hypothetical protein ACFQ8Q_00340 [Streptomyces cyaneofuscatus]|uniref:hypothetical protein n=1 Tax=Streptomyces cyaneofuscatus TaxID=66883 RepID=UPI0036CF46F7
MTDIDLAKRIEYLRQLGSDFGDLQSQVLDVDAVPGTPALNALTPLYFRAQGLATRLAAQVAGLDAGPYTQVPGSRESLDALRAAIGTASLAAADLAHALAANPLDGTRFGGRSEHDARFRDQEHAEAAPVLAEHLQEAARQLDLCSTICHYVAHGITEDTRQAPEAVVLPAPVRLNSEEHEALSALAKGGARLEVRDRCAHIVIVDGTQVSTAVFRSLNESGLLHHDESVPLRRGRDLTVTEEGRRALAHQPRPAPPSAPSPAPVRVSHRGGR